MEAVKQQFKQYFEHWNIELPEHDLDNRSPGFISKAGWSIRYIFGKDTVKEAIAVPEEVRLKVTTDYGRSKGMAWYFLGEWKIMWETEANARIIKWDSAG